MRYRLYCTYCGWNRWTDGTDLTGLVMYPRSKVQTAIPQYDQKAKKWVQKDALNQPRQFRCGGCGRAVTAKKTIEKKNDGNNPGNQNGNGGPDVPPGPPG